MFVYITLIVTMHERCFLCNNHIYKNLCEAIVLYQCRGCKRMVTICVNCGLINTKTSIHNLKSLTPNVRVCNYCLGYNLFVTISGTKTAHTDSKTAHTDRRVTFEKDRD